MTDWKPQLYIPDFDTMWCARVITFLKCTVRTEIPNADGNVDETLECAYVHFLSRYNPPVGECDYLHECRGNVMMYETNPPVLGVVPTHYILGKLPVVRAGDSGRIPCTMKGRHLKSRCFPDGKCDQNESDTSDSNLYFVNHHALTWSRML
jgi:hypothetical protein